MASAAHGAPSEPLTPTAYIAEHLQNLNNIGGAQASIIDFSVINLDTLFWTILMGLLAAGFLLLARFTHALRASASRTLVRPQCRCSQRACTKIANRAPTGRGCGWC